MGRTEEHQEQTVRAEDSTSIFVSHASADRTAARELADVMSRAGYRTWLAPDDVDSSRSWPAQIAAAIEAAAGLVVVLTKPSIASDHVAREVTLAVELDKPVVPVRLRDIMPAGALRYLLAICQWTDAFPGRIADHAARLVEAVREALGSSEPIGGTEPVSPSPARPDLPVPLTSFVGRDQELAETDKLLAGARLVTLIGPGGSGKTRLALELVRNRTVQDGTAWVDLAPITDPEKVVGTVARTLGITADPLADTIVDALRDSGTLIILDNCEQVVDEAARFVEKLLSSCPKTRVLATSREPLRILGEAVYVVPPLSLPDSSSAPDLRRTLRYEAVRLFAERAEAANLGFRIGPTNLGLVVQACQRLDGIPLALELAAARLATMTIDELVERLDDRFAILTGGSRTALPRHQTLLATLDWSYGLLPPRERETLDSLSVFTGSFDLAAAEAVAANDDVSARSMLDVLEQLAIKSVVQVTQHDGKSRYRLLETIRAYAGRHLAESDAAAHLQRRHAEHYTERVEEVFTGIAAARDPDTREEAITNLALDHADLTSSLAWAASPEGDRHLGCRLAKALARYWYLSGTWLEGRSLSAALFPLDPETPPVHRAQAEFALGFTGSFAGDPQQAKHHLERALGLADELDDEELIGAASGALGRVLHLLGQDDDAARLHRRAADIAARRGNRWGEGAASVNLGVIAQDDGRFEEAAAWFDRGMDVAIETGDRRLMGVTTGNLGLLAVQQGDYDRARPLLAAAAAMARSVGERSNEAWALGVMGYVALMREEPDRALGMFLRALPIHHDLGEADEVAHMLPNVAQAHAGLGRAELAARLTGASEGISSRLGIPYPEPIPGAQEELEALVEELTRVLGEERLEAALAEGRLLTVEEAVAAAGSATEPVKDGTAS